MGEEFKVEDTIYADGDNEEIAELIQDNINDRAQDIVDGIDLPEGEYLINVEVIVTINEA